MDPNKQIAELIEPTLRDMGFELVRVLLQAVRADFYNPVSQFIVRLTNPALHPLRRFIPAVGRLDTAAVVLIIVLEIIGVWISYRSSRCRVCRVSSARTASTVFNTSTARKEKSPRFPIGVLTM